MHRRGTATTPSAARTTTPDYLREDDEELSLVPSTAARPLRGILRLLEGQIVSSRNRAATFRGEWATTRLGNPYEGLDAGAAFVAMHRYHGPTLRESHSNLQKQKRKKRRRIPRATNTTTSTTGETQPIVGSSSQSGLEQEQLPQHPHSWTRLDNVVSRHKFVAIFVVQGVANASGNFCYSPHTLELRKILATDYHDVLTTLVLDVGNCSSSHSHDNNNNSMLPSFGGDEETGGGGNDDDSPEHNPFCVGTGFGLLPLSSTTSTTALALLNVTKIPSLLVLDATSGRIVSRDAILAVERNDSHGVVNRWQAGKSGLTLFQQLVAVITCDCHHGPCCDGGCAIQ